MRNYKKYKWFYTSTGKLVVGGKNAKQNDELLESLKDSGKEYIVMHTSHPGSPFSVIVSSVKRVTKKDLEECAVFTGCFSRAWKEGKFETEIHIFRLSEVEKKGKMKTGTWGVNGRLKKIRVKLELVLAKQKGKLRAVPEASVRNKEVLLKVFPGKTDKTKMADKIIKKLGNKIKKEDLLAALPAGGVKVC